MTTIDLTHSRVDLFTDIHKGLRKGLFDLSVQAGATDWDERGALAALAAAWKPLVELLRCHTEHEDNHIFRLLDGIAKAAVVPEEDHRDLDDLLDDLDDRLRALEASPSASAGLAWYRDLNRYVAASLQHLHVEETVVLPALWAERSDEELNDCRDAFLATTAASVMDTTLQLFRAALPPSVQRSIGLDGR